MANLWSLGDVVKLLSFEGSMGFALLRLAPFFPGRAHTVRVDIVFLHEEHTRDIVTHTHIWCI